MPMQKGKAPSFCRFRASTRVYCFGLRVEGGLGLRVQGLGFKFLVFRVEGIGFMVWGLGCKV